MEEHLKVNQYSIEKAYKRIFGLLLKTPILQSSNLNSLTAKNLFFKCENFQKTGSFKSRGALNSIRWALESNPNLKGVITHSSGNHGQALAWAASKSGIECTVVVPEGAPLVKIEAIQSYGANIIKCKPTLTERQNVCDKISKENGHLIIDPHNDYNVMSGQGTIAIELLDQVPELEAVILSVGGGGLIAGVSKYIKDRHPHIKVFCAVPDGKNLESQIENLKNNKMNKTGELLNTIADGIRVKDIGDKCLPLIEESCQKVVFNLNNEEIKIALELIWQRLKVVVEASAALPLAAVLKYSKELSEFKNIGLILCGGNINLENLLP